MSNRRADINQMIPAELAIRAAILEVEKLPAAEELTTVVVTLDEARGKLADWIEANGYVKPS